MVIMKKIMISILTAMSMFMSALPIVAAAAEMPEVVDLIHSSGTTVRSGVTVKTHYVKNSGTAEAPEKQTVTTNAHVDYYGAPETIFDGNTTGIKNQCIITYNYDVYFQIDLGERRTITDIVYTVKSSNDSAKRLDDMNNFIIELSNDPEFADDLGDPVDVVIAYAKGNDNDAQNVHTAKVSYEMPYRYIRISALNDDFMVNKREICVSELEVYGYLNDSFPIEDLSSGAIFTDPDGATVTKLNDGITTTSNCWTRTGDELYVTMDLGTMCQISNITIRPYMPTADIALGKYRKGISVWVSNDFEFGDYEVLRDGTNITAPRKNIELGVDMTLPGYRYIRVVNTAEAATTIGLTEVSVTGYNLFDAYAELDISEDGSTVYAYAKDGGQKMLILAEYDKKGKCLDIKSVSSSEIAVMDAHEGSIYKAFLWTSLESSVPVTKSVFLIK